MVVLKTSSSLSARADGRSAPSVPRGRPSHSVAAPHRDRNHERRLLLLPLPPLPPPLLLLMMMKLLMMLMMLMLMLMLMMMTSSPVPSVSTSPAEPALPPSASLGLGASPPIEICPRSSPQASAACCSTAESRRLSDQTSACTRDVSSLKLIYCSLYEELLYRTKN